MSIGTLTALGLGLAGAGAASGIASAATSKDKVSNKWLQNPEYPEAEGARKNWWETLQQWGSDPNYGAISPDWSNIWDTVQRQVKEYYSGGPLTTGVRDKLKASLARRNVSGSPAADYLMMASGADEANKMKDIATEQATKKAELSEQGRRDWLSSLMMLAQQKPEGQWQTTVTPNKTSQVLGAVSQGLGSVSTSMVDYGTSSEWLDALKSGSLGNVADMPNATVSPYWLDTSKWR